MIDNIRLCFKEKNLVENWFNKNLEKFPVYTKKSIVSEDSEFSTYPIIAHLENMRLVINEKTCHLEGSLHKFYNNVLSSQLSNKNLDDGYSNDNYCHLQDNNYNDFHYVEIIMAIEYLIDFFDGLDLNNASISELEFGFNVITKKQPSEYKDLNFLLYEYKAPIKSKSKKGEYFSRFEHSKFEYKVYSKKDQKKLKTNVMRIEIVLKSNHLKQLGIIQFTDLLALNNIELIFSYFLRRFEKFIIVDNRCEKENLPKEILHEIGNYLEPSFWKARRKVSNTNRIKNRLNKLLIDFDMLSTKNYLIGLIENKFNQLMHGVVNDDELDLKND